MGRNKSGREEAITDAIERLTLGLNQMRLLSDALNYADVKSSVQKVYERVESFCIKSVKYYNMAPWGTSSQGYKLSEIFH